MTACSKEAVRVEYVDRVVEVQKPLDPRLTERIFFPGPPPPACADRISGRPTLCEDQLHEWMDVISERLWEAISRIDEIRALQPEGHDDFRVGEAE